MIPTRNFTDRILSWNESAGNIPPELGTLDVEALRLQCKFVGEEFSEVMDELDVLEVDATKVAKELGDIVFTAIEGIRRAGFDPEVVMQLLCDSNDSKFAANSQEINAAEQFFKKRRIAVVLENVLDGLVVFKSARDQVVNGKMFIKGKILKTPSYFEAEPAIREYHTSLLEELF
jgi:hypothetical protein